jgi:hypothetical protein
VNTFKLISLISIIFIFASCKKDDNSSQNSIVNDYYDIVVEGVTYKQEITNNNATDDYNSASGLYGQYDVIFTSSIYNVNQGGTSMEVLKGIFKNYFDASFEDFKNYFSVGNYSFAKSGTNDSGFRINWYDKNGKGWASNNGSADQTGSSISITELKEELVLGETYLKPTISFKCKLYDENGNAIQASGIYVGPFKK